ncbi:MAG: radical SAM protein [Marinilabiliales bacterium]|nr:MAG: radical SAM protein [Marinilabiliales bacterium]
MLDSYNRRINYLRVSVTDRCNLRCRYCMPCGDFVMLRHEDILRFAEIAEVVREGAAMGIDRVRITGGEPLVRRDIVKLTGMIASVKGIKDLSMTTNGILLERFAGPLREAGLMRVNVSLDTMDRSRFSELTSGGNIDDVIRGIDAALSAGLGPVKINCVVNSSTGFSGSSDAGAVKEFAENRGLQVRFIHQMDLDGGEFSVVEGGEGGDCSRCNRLRLTASGKVKPCLFSDIGFDVRTLGARNALLAAVTYKPEHGTACSKDHFYNIGG